jgi:hypothetical protein
VRVGIVGHEGAKFSIKGAAAAQAIIRELLRDPTSVMVSGGCHLGGVDIWAEEIADELGREKIVCLPKNLRWEPQGYKQRNLEIVYESDILHCIAVDRLAPTFTGRRHTECYHCGETDHVKSGGCWTMKQAKRQGKPTHLHIVQNADT